MTQRLKKTRTSSSKMFALSTALFGVLVTSLFLFERHAFLAEASEKGVGIGTEKGVGVSTRKSKKI